MDLTREEVVGVVVAGGLSRRMGGRDKAARPLLGRSLLDHVVERARPQVADLLLNLNGEPPSSELPVRRDAVPGRPGPLAGILTGLEWAREVHPGAGWLASFPVDAPFFPPDLVARLAVAADPETEVVCARSGGRLHPLFGLWRVDLAEALRRDLVDSGVRRVGQWASGRVMAAVEFPVGDGDPFFNVNAPEDLAAAEVLLKR